VGFDYSVQTDEIIKLGSQIDIAGDEFLKHVKPNLEGAKIPLITWPLIGLGAHGTYEQAHTFMGKATDAVNEAITAISRAVHQVADWYKKAEESNTIKSGG
jgi:hypothetical protein